MQSGVAKMFLILTIARINYQRLSWHEVAGIFPFFWRVDYHDCWAFQRYMALSHLFHDLIVLLQNLVVPLLWAPHLEFKGFLKCFQEHHDLCVVLIVPMIIPPWANFACPEPCGTSFVGPPPGVQRLLTRFPGTLWSLYGPYSAPDSPPSLAIVFEQWNKPANDIQLIVGVFKQLLHDRLPFKQPLNGSIRSLFKDLKLRLSQTS